MMNSTCINIFETSSPFSVLSQKFFSMKAKAKPIHVKARASSDVNSSSFSSATLLLALLIRLAIGYGSCWRCRNVGCAFPNQPTPRVPDGDDEDNDCDDDDSNSL